MNVMKAWAETLKVGEELTPDPAWNASERPFKYLPDRVKVLEVKYVTSQTGVLLRVRVQSGLFFWLDAGWFTGRAV